MSYIAILSTLVGLILLRMNWSHLKCLYRLYRKKPIEYRIQEKGYYAVALTGNTACLLLLFINQPYFHGEALATVLTGVLSGVVFICYFVQRRY